MRFSFGLAFLILLSGFLSGCGDSPAQSAKPASKAAASGADAVLVRVGKHELRRGDLLRRVAMMGALQEYRNPRLSKAKLGKYRESLSKSFPGVFVQTAVLEDYAAAEKLTVTKEMVGEFEKNAFKRLKLKNDKTLKSYADLRKKIGEYGPELDAQVRAEALRQAVYNHFLELYPTNIPDSYVDDQLRRFESYNRSATLTNALIYAKATNVWEQLKKGADFGEMAVKYSDLEDERESKGEWGTLDRRQLNEDPEILAWGLKLKPGEFSPPIEGDNGLMIMRLDERDEKCTEFAVTRIFFQLPQFYEPAPREEIKKAAYDKYGRELFVRKIAELEKAAKPEYFQVNGKIDKKETK